ncbi:MAG: NAD-dependent epimerase/dehydratase family protein [bacterium]
MDRILITGGAGFVGSHVTEYYARKGKDVVVLDNLSREKLLGKSEKNAEYNWNYLKQYENISLIRGDVRDLELLTETCRNVDIIIHAAAQTAVTTSLSDPWCDFSVNALGSFNLLEAVRKAKIKPAIIYCSTNKVYGENVNKIGVIQEESRYRFEDRYEKGIPEDFDIDLCEHTPYGCSKLTGDLYMQDYAWMYGLKVGVFRMSCIYGTRQFGVEDQGWLAWFAIATILNKPITIYGDGKQVRDVLYITDLIEAYDAFINSDLPQGVFNIGGGPQKTLSLLESLNLLEEITGKKAPIKFSDWRPSDQKVYISDISKAKEELHWNPRIKPKEGLGKLVNWIEENREIFK